MGYFDTSMSGVKWIGSFKILSRILSLVRIAILARILSPIQFGVFGIASLSLSVVETLTEPGIYVYLMQEKKSIHKYIDTAWVISILRGVLLFTTLIFSSGIISGFFNTPEVKHIINLIALVVLIRGFMNPLRVNFLKQLDYRKEFSINSLVLSVDIVVTVLSVALFKDPLGLVLGLIAGAIVEVILSFALIKYHPKIKFDIRLAKKITSAGKWVTGSTIFNFLFSEGDDTLVGKLLGKYDLGIYQISYKIATLPLTEITNVANTVTFPIFVQISNEKKRIAKVFIKTALIIGLLSFVLSTFIFLFADTIVAILLGSAWSDSVDLIKLLVIFGFIRAIAISCNPLFNALKKQKYVTLYTTISFVLMAMTIFPLMQKFGLRGVIYSVIISSSISFLVNVINVIKVLK